MKITNVGSSLSDPFDNEGDATAAMLACGFDASSLESMDILAAYDPRGGVVEVVVFSDVGIWAGNNCDGWNAVNSLAEIGNLTCSEIDKIYGDGASELPIWRAYLERLSTQ